mgnify:CR=1 FL=1
MINLAVIAAHRWHRYSAPSMLYNKVLRRLSDGYTRTCVHVRIRTCVLQYKLLTTQSREGNIYRRSCKATAPALPGAARRILGNQLFLYPVEYPY